MLQKRQIKQVKIATLKQRNSVIFALISMRFFALNSGKKNSLTYVSHGFGCRYPVRHSQVVQCDRN